MAQHASGASNPPLVEIVLDFGTEDTAWVTAMSTARLFFPPVHRTPEKVKVSPRAPCLVPDTPSTVPVPGLPFISGSLFTPVRADIHEKEKIVLINRSALFRAPPSARMFYAGRSMYSRSLSRAKMLNAFGARSVLLVFLIAALPNGSEPRQVVASVPLQGAGRELRIAKTPRSLEAGGWRGYGNKGER